MANGLLDLLGGAFGTSPPEYMQGLLGADAVENLRKRSIGSGLVNALIGYAAAPKNQNLGLGRILASAAQSGIQGAQGVYQNATQDYMTQEKIAEMQRQRKQQTAQDLFRSRIGQPNASRDIVTQDNRQVPVAQGAENPNFQTQMQPPTVTKEQYFDRDKMMQEALQSGALSPEKYLELTAKQNTPDKYSQAGGYVLDKTTGVATKIEGYKADSGDGTPDIKNFEYAKAQGYKGSLTDYIQIKPQAMYPIAAANLGINQQQQKLDEAASDYKYNRPQNISVTAGGKVFYFPNQASADAFRKQTTPKVRK